MAFTVTAKNEALDGVVLGEIRLHSSDPTATGTAGAIAGATKVVSYSLSAAGSRDLTETAAVDIAEANTVVSHFSLWGGGELKAYKVFTSNAETFANPGTANVTTAEITLTDVV